MEQKNGRRPKREVAQQEEQPRNTKVRVTYSALNHSRNLTSTMDFEWPEFTKETDRIKAYTKRFVDKSIPEIFGITTKVENVNQYDTLRELKAGDTIDVIVHSITDDNVVFETVATKQVVQSAVNLKKYKALQYKLPLKTIAIVTKANREIAYIDILKPMYESWLTAILKDPDVQRDTLNGAQSIEVKNLQLTRGGFIGQAIIPCLTNFLGQEYTVEAFIPGSQIVLNIEDNFQKWNGHTVGAFVTNYMLKPGTKSDMSLICSRKELLKFWGDQQIIRLFNAYCTGGEEWSKETSYVYNGVVTGIINSSKKCGVFVEIPDLFITGMVSIDADKLVNYKPGDKLKVRISDFEENTYYDQLSGQIRHEAPYVIEDGILRSCDIKPILSLA